MSIEATPVNLDMGYLTIRRSDNQLFTLPLSSLNEASQEAVWEYFNNSSGSMTDSLPAPPGLSGTTIKPPKIAAREGDEGGAPEVELSRDGNTVELLVYSDSLSDYLKVHDVHELDLMQVVLSRKGSRTMGVELYFNPIKDKSLLDSEYRIWFNLDVDNDKSTGMSVSHKEGVDLSAAIHGNGSGREWEFYTVAKSDEGRGIELEVDSIKIGVSSIAFEVECEAFRRSNVFGLSMSLCKDGGKVVDHFPNKGVTPISFDHAKFREANP